MKHYLTIQRSVQFNPLFFFETHPKVNFLINNLIILYLMISLYLSQSHYHFIDTKLKLVLGIIHLRLYQLSSDLI